MVYAHQRDCTWCDGRGQSQDVGGVYVTCDMCNGRGCHDKDDDDD